MYLSCSSESYAPEINGGRLSLTDWFRVCAEELGLRSVELEDKHIGGPTAARINELTAAASRLGLQIVNIALMNNFGLTDGARRRAEEDRTVEWMKVSRDLGSRFLRTFAGWPEGDRAERWPAMIASLKTVCARAQAAGVPLVMENHNHGGFVQTAADVAAIFDAVGSPALSLLLDTGNFIDGRPSIVRTARLARHVHAKFTQVGEDGRDARIDNAGALELLRTAGYRGAVSVEYEGEEPGRTAVPRALAHLRSLGLTDTPA
ncbi:MAG TPA: sugar phosphate isomerase/epimerase family protein [bacterium]|nr:sugar phosphate isomerase/epimerase family protein [bacterium]